MVSRRLGYPSSDDNSRPLRSGFAEKSAIMRIHTSPQAETSDSNWSLEEEKGDEVEEAFDDIEKLITEFPNHLFWDTAILARLENLISSSGLFSGPIASWYQGFYQESYDARRKVEDMKITDILQKGKKYQEILFGEDFLVRHVNSNVFYTEEERTRNRKWSIAHKIYLKFMGYDTVDLAKKYAPLTPSLSSGQYDQELKEAWGIGEMNFSDLLGATAMYSVCFGDKAARLIDESDRILIEDLFKKYTGNGWEFSQAVRYRGEWRRCVTDDKSRVLLKRQKKANMEKSYKGRLIRPNGKKLRTG